MTLQSWLIYLALVLVATSTPGPTVLFIMTNSTLHGWRKASLAALGNIVGLLLLGILAIAGLGTVLGSSESLFRAIKYAGAIYLIYLGIKQILYKDAALNAQQQRSIPQDFSAKRIFFQALGVAISNPKAIIFLTALFPQFIHTESSLVPQFSILITTLMIFSFIFLMAYSLLADKTKRWLNSTHRFRIINRISGSIFIGFGFMLAGTSKN